MSTAPHEVLRSWFLGPRAENADLLERLVTEALRDHVFWRRNYHPEDGFTILETDRRTRGGSSHDVRVGRHVADAPMTGRRERGDEPDEGDAARLTVETGRSDDVGHEARCTLPCCHHDHTSSVTKGRNGANRRSIADKAALPAETAEAAAASSPARRLFTSSM